MKSVSMKWAADHVNSIELIDVRTPAEFGVKHIEGSKNIPLVGFVNNHSEFLEKGKTYYIMCHSGGRSANAINTLAEHGYDLVQVDGGISAI